MLNRKEYRLEGLDCANCAVRMETKLKNLAGVTNASVNFGTSTMVIESDQPDLHEIEREAKRIIREIEPGIVIEEQTKQQGAANSFLLLGLSCAGCSSKIEAAIKALPEVESAALDFVGRRLTVNLRGTAYLQAVEESIKEIVRQFEPSVVVKREAREAAAEHAVYEAPDRSKYFFMAGGALLYFAVLLLQLRPAVEVIIFLLSYLLIGGEVVVRAVRNLLRGQLFDENFLMTIATIGAFAIQEYPEAVAVMLFYQIGEFFQDLAVDRSRRSIQALLDIRSDYANLKQGEQVMQVPPQQVAVGESIIIKPGERVPLDGRIVAGQSVMDTSALTGEALPRTVQAGDVVLSGFINNGGVLEVEVTQTFAESTVAKILDLVQNAGSRKAPTENFITKFARFYTPAVVMIAAALAVIPPLILPQAAFSAWLYRALVFLVVSCPCALVVSIPLGFFGGIGGASRSGILIKGGNYLEALNDVETVVFDKTGTLTKGTFKVISVVPAAGVTETELLEAAAIAETYSNHPIAKSIVQAYGEEVTPDRITSFEEIAGHGSRVVSGGRTILAGNSKLMAQAEIEYQVPDQAGTVVYVAVDGRYAGSLIIADEIKGDSAATMKQLKKLGVKKLVMLTGDNQQVAAAVAEQLQLDAYYAELLPQDKVGRLEELYAAKGRGKLIFVGDGINDAPVLARADVGVAMGGLGSDAAIEAADVVLMTDEPSKLVTAIKIARRTRTIVWQNIILALTVKGIVLALGAGGIVTLWEAVFADVGVALLAILNALRVLRLPEA